MERRTYAMLCLLACLYPVRLAAQYATSDCDVNRGVVRTGKLVGGSFSPDATTGGTPITLEEFLAIKYQNASDPDSWPSKIAPSSRVGGEGTIYQIDNLEIGGFSQCESAVGVELEKEGDFGGYDFGEINGGIPHASCRPAGLAEAMAKAYTNYSTRVSVWRTVWDDTECGVSGGENTQPIRVIGVSFWDDGDGSHEPRLTLSPILAIIPMSDLEGGGGDGDGGGGDGGGTPSTPAPPPPFQVNLPAEFGIEPVIIENSDTRTVKFTTAHDSTINSDVHLSVVSDAPEWEDFHVEVNPPVIAAPGAGEGEITIRTGPMTFPRGYLVTVLATAGEKTYASAFTLRIECTPPFILGLDQPQSIAVPANHQGELKVNASGSGPFQYEWYRGMTGMTRDPVESNGASLLVNSTGMERYWVRVKNACGSVDSMPALVSTTP